MSSHMVRFEGIVDCLDGHYDQIVTELGKFTSGKRDMSRADLWEPLEKAVEAFNEDVKLLLGFRPKNSVTGLVNPHDLR